MKMLCKNKLKIPIQVNPGDQINVQHTLVAENTLTGEVTRITREVAKIPITKLDSFDIAFIMELEPNDLGFEAGYIGGIAR